MKSISLSLDSPYVQAPKIAEIGDNEVYADKRKRSTSKHSGYSGGFLGEVPAPSIPQPPFFTQLGAWYVAEFESYANDDLINIAHDQTGNGNHVTAAGTARPTFKTAVVSGKPVFRFNGTTNTLTKTSGVVGLDQSAGFTYYVVVGNATFGVSAGMVISAQNAAGTKFTEIRARFGPGDIWQAIGADGAGASDGAVGATFRIVGSTYPVGVGSNEIHCYEKDVFSAGAFETGTNIVDKISLGSRFGSLFLAQDIVEILCYRAILPVAPISAYLTNRYPTI